MKKQQPRKKNDRQAIIDKIKDRLKKKQVKPTQLPKIASPKTTPWDSWPYRCCPCPHCPGHGFYPTIIW